MGNLINGSCSRNMRNMTQDANSRNAQNIDPIFPPQQNSYNQGLNNSIFSGRIGNQSEENFPSQGPNANSQQHFALRTVSSEQKYWKDAARKSLYANSFWVTNNNGLLTQYL